jgi:hypothetical protein
MAVPDSMSTSTQERPVVSSDRLFSLIQGRIKELVSEATRTSCDTDEHWMDRHEARVRHSALFDALKIMNDVWLEEEARRGQ